jgi:AcrR family transcriptional regulator
VRKAAADRREELLRAALDVVREQGFAAVTLRGVAARVGVAHGLIRHYFPSRGALLSAAFDRAVDDEVAALPAGVGEPLDQLAAACLCTDDPHYLLWIDAWAEATRDRELAGTLRRHQRDWERELRRAVQAVLDAGLVDVEDGADAASSARQLTALLDGLALQRHALHQIGRAEHDRRALAGVERLLGLPGGSLGERRPASGR